MEPDGVVAIGDGLQTGDADHTLIGLPDKGQLLVDFDTAVRVSTPAETDESVGSSLQLLNGQIWVWSPGDGDPIQVKTPQGTAWVRRGEAVVSVLRSRAVSGGRVSGPTEVTALRGEVNLLGPGVHLVEIPAGHSLRIQSRADELLPQERPLFEQLRVCSVWNRRYVLY